ncbi:hypothetical protein HHI36_017227 [Cryptolaemus montrouzieri]
MARLHDSRRPLVVSFRRKGAQASPYRDRLADKSSQNFDGNLPEVREHRMNGLLENGMEKKISIPIHEEKLPDDSRVQELTYVEVHTLQPTHICPLSFSQLQSTESLRIESISRGHRNHHSRSLNCDVITDSETGLYKSCTMPNIAKLIIFNDTDKTTLHVN